MDTPKILLEMSEEEKIVFGLMKYEEGHVYRTLEQETKLEKKTLKKIIKKLKDLKLIELTSFIHEEEQGYFGRGWTLSGFGEGIQNHLEEKYL